MDEDSVESLAAGAAVVLVEDSSVVVMVMAIGRGSAVYVDGREVAVDFSGEWENDFEFLKY